MSSEDVNLAAPTDEPLWMCTYGGPLRADGGPRRRVQLTREGQYVSLSVEELERFRELTPPAAPPRIYLAHFDSDQPIDAAKTTREAAQRVVEELAAEFYPGNSCEWQHLARQGYPTTWAYVQEYPSGAREHRGHVQLIEVTE